MNESASTFRERAGVLAAWAIILAYISIGFVQFFLGWWSGSTSLTFDPAWTGSMNGLAGGAVGFLIGKQTTNQPSTTTTVTPATVTTTVTADATEGKP